jgi:hypothetical protein
MRQMHCTMCAFSKPGDIMECPVCGHRFIPLSEHPRIAVSRHFARTMLYFTAFCVLAEGFRRLGVRYEEAASYAAESTLLGQLMERKARIASAGAGRARE